MVKSCFGGSGQWLLTSQSGSRSAGNPVASSRQTRARLAWTGYSAGASGGSKPEGAADSPTIRKSRFKAHTCHQGIARPPLPFLEPSSGTSCPGTVNSCHAHRLAASATPGLHVAA